MLSVLGLTLAVIDYANLTALVERLIWTMLSSHERRIDDQRKQYAADLRGTFQDVLKTIAWILVVSAVAVAAVGALAYFGDRSPRERPLDTSEFVLALAMWWGLIACGLLALTFVLAPIFTAYAWFLALLLGAVHKCVKQLRRLPRGLLGTLGLVLAVVDVGSNYLGGPRSN